MSFEDELSEQMRSSVEHVSVSGDLASVEARSAQVVHRRRVVLGASVGALVVLAVGSLVVLAGRGSDGAVTSPTDSQPSATDPVDTAPATAPADTEPTDAVPPETIEATSVPTSAALPNGSGGPDPADPYLEGSTEIYRRTLPNGDVFVARLSDDSYASTFGLEWRAPTGSADECVGDHAVFIGVPERMGYWGSAWVAAPWYDDVDVAEPVVVASMMSAVGGAMVDPTSDDASHLLVRTAPNVTEVAVVRPDGHETDRADVVGGMAVVSAPSSWSSEGAVRLRAVTEDDPNPGTVALEYRFRPERGVDDPCGPGPAPELMLPEAGEQPAAPAAAEAQIRDRHAMLVDQSIPADQKPQDLLDDDTGVADALAEARRGTYAESIAGATYEIDDLVFTDPNTAWFRYTITAPTGTFADRFGIATYNGSVWQITRATICADLSLAGGSCDPPYVPIEPPYDAGWDAAYQEWMERASLYFIGDGCSPLSQC